jgi:hypothetical protein
MRFGQILYAFIIVIISIPQKMMQILSIFPILKLVNFHWSSITERVVRKM